MQTLSIPFLKKKQTLQTCYHMDDINDRKLLKNCMYVITLGFIACVEYSLKEILLRSKSGLEFLSKTISCASGGVSGWFVADFLMVTLGCPYPYVNLASKIWLTGIGGGLATYGVSFFYKNKNLPTVYVQYQSPEIKLGV